MNSPAGMDGGATAADRASRAGETRDLEIPSPALRELAAMVFVCVFASVILFALLLLRLIPFGEVFSVK